jgi:superfamily II DNA or RNA helicase
MNVDDFRTAYLDPEQRESLKRRKKTWESFQRARRVMAIQRHAIAKCLQELTNNPETVIEGHTWSQTQSEMLEAVTWALRHGYMHIVGKVPTGGGKSHVLGAIIRSIHDARAELLNDPRLGLQDQELLHLEEEAETVLLTSRRNLVKQLIRNSTAQNGTAATNGDPEASNMDDDDQIEMGD